jgi:D-alanine-D-alanine ligase
MRGRDLQIAVTYNYESHVYGGDAHDLVSLQYTVETAQNLYQALLSLGYSAVKIAIQDGSLETFQAELTHFSPEHTFVFNNCDAFAGKSLGSATITRLIEDLGFRHTGSTADVIERCTHKAHAKECLLANGLPTPAFQVFDQPEGEISINFPIIVKPLTEDGSLGIDLRSVVTTSEDLFARVQYVIEHYDQPALAEEFIAGREFAVSMWGNDTVKALPITEEDYYRIPDPLKWLLTYESKWLPESPFYQYIYVRCPADMDTAEEVSVLEASISAYRALDLRDFGRVDIRYDHNIPYIIDVNEIPDLSRDSGFPNAALVGGYSYMNMVEHILDLALKREGWR